MLEPDAASTTFLPVFAQAVRAACTREVSSVVVGVLTSTALEVNCAERVWQTPVGVEGCENSARVAGGEGLVRREEA